MPNNFEKATRIKKSLIRMMERAGLVIIWKRVMQTIATKGCRKRTLLKFAARDRISDLEPRKRNVLLLVIHGKWQYRKIGLYGSSQGRKLKKR